jgi:transcriptional regulator with XRE-family HTH domain
MSSTQETLKRTEIRAVLRANKGSIQRIADQLGIKQQNISKWLRGQTVSARIAEAAQSEALRLQAQSKTTIGGN